LSGIEGLKVPCAGHRNRGKAHCPPLKLSSIPISGEEEEAYFGGIQSQNLRRDFGWRSRDKGRDGRQKESFKVNPMTAC
jgi:hypothetical protein